MQIERLNHFQQAQNTKSNEELAHLLCQWEPDCDTCSKWKFCRKDGSKENGWQVFLRRYDYQLEDDLNFMEDR